MKRLIILFLVFSLALVSCTKKKKPEDIVPSPNPITPTTPPDINNTFGYGVLNKVKGIWNGPVTSSTPLGSYPEWIVDFRPVAPGQVSAKNELDTLNDIHMSFFIALYNNQYRVAFRNGGGFAGAQRVSYFLCDSVNESPTQDYYRFSEILKGPSRAFTEVVLRNDSLYIKSYTNKYNSLPSAVLHMTWAAKLQDTTSCADAVAHFNFPQKTMSKDLSNAFTGKTEAVYYSLAGDPYPESDQPYLGKTTINYSFAPGFVPVASKKVFIVITTQPLITGVTLNLANLKYRSRYVILSASDLSFTFNYMHPGSYYVYALYDNDGNNYFNSGDWVSALNTNFTLGSTGTASASTQINFNIP